MQVQQYAEKWGAENLLAPICRLLRPLRQQLSPLRRTSSLQISPAMQLDSILKAMQDTQEELASTNSKATR